MQDFSMEALSLESYKYGGCDATFAIDAMHMGEEIGTATVVVEPSEVYLSSVEVELGFRDKRLGSLLVGEAVKFAKSRKDIASVYTYAQNERTVSAFCGLFRPDQLAYWLTEFVDGEPVERPIDSTPAEVVELLSEIRLEEFGNIPEGSEAATEILPSGVGIRAHLL